MTQNNGCWQDLISPGIGEGLLEGWKEVEFQSEAGAFSWENAWWLSELSRLSYAGFERRAKALEEVGLEEGFFCRVGSAQAVLLRSAGTSEKAFAVLVFKGTSSFGDWFANLDSVTREWSGGGHVHGGFLRALDGLWGELGPRLEALEVPLFLTGHSLGAALATLTASRMVGQFEALYTFGSPRVGTGGFCESLAAANCYRVTNGSDLVTAVPTGLGKIGRMAFTHVGQLVQLGDAPAKGVGIGGQAVQLARELAGGMGMDQPPVGLCDHAPIRYSEMLRQKTEET